MPIELHSLLTGLLVFGLFPAWMLAGLLDYICHRRTQIENTSGRAESRFHIAQFLTLGFALTLSTVLSFSSSVLAAVTLLVVVHTALAFADTWYTEQHRLILPFEQMIHDFMDLLPVIAVCILVAINWPLIANHSIQWRRGDTTALHAAILLGSYWILSGGLVLEEWLRTRPRQ